MCLIIAGKIKIIAGKIKRIIAGKIKRIIAGKMPAPQEL
jgi:hypothetical protein